MAVARRAYEVSLALLREVGAERDAAGTLHNSAHACLHKGDLERAAALFRESLLAQQAIGNEAGVAECLLGLGALAASNRLPGAAARLLAAADVVRLPTANLWPAERMEHDRYLSSPTSRAATSCC